MLKGIPQILSPELLMVLCEMGHGDRIVISDGNFPAESMGKDAIVIRCDGHGVPELLDASSGDSAGYLRGEAHESDGSYAGRSGEDPHLGYL